MSYTVRWSRPALDALALMWLENPTERAAITQAAQTADRLLQVVPQTQGESRDAGRRIAFVPPLAMIFAVDEAQATVSILNVRQLKRRSAE